MLFPPQDRTGPRTRITLRREADGLPTVVHAGLVDPGPDSPDSRAPRHPAAAYPSPADGPGLPWLGEQSAGRFTRPHLRGHRIEPFVGVDWTTRFGTTAVGSDGDRLEITAEDSAAGLLLVSEVEAGAGGVLRARHTLRNTGAGAYVVDGLEVVLPLEDDLVEVLDFTGRHERERSPQRHAITDGLWLREGRTGRPGLDAASLVVAGTPGFTTTTGRVVGVHVAWSGNAVLRVERDAATGATLGGGEHLLPGEVVLAEGASYTSPWVVFVAADDGLDGLAAALHTWQRALPAHPELQPVVLNVWEAVYFDHDLTRLTGIADRAAAVGVERFVLDDGWFTARRDDTRGLGDWDVDPAVWPEGLTPLVDRVHDLGMEFGLWIEPEMVNPDSDLYRAHPDWVLSPADRVPRLHRHQLALDLGRPEVFEHVRRKIGAVLATYPVDYVKWDHNRDLLEAGSADRGGAPGVHRQTLAFYDLLDTLRADHPGIAWESCASGGGRIDLGVLERVQRVWASDMTDALSRQQIQRWTTQLVAPEYVGAHVSSPTSHTTGRTLPLDFRAGTAVFGAFGIEWDLTTATADDLDRLADWVERHKRFRPVLHSGRVVRPESSDPAVLLHGVVAADAARALVAHVQVDESGHNRGVSVRVPGLRPDATYALAWEGPVDHAHTSMSAALPEVGPTDGVPVSGRFLARQGFWMPRRRPETVTLVRVDLVR